MDDVKNETMRESYEPPTIEDMPLRAEELVIAGCKTPFGLSPISGGDACSFNTCVNANGS